MDGGDSRELGERIWMELHRIANALESLIQSSEEPPTSTEAPMCSHPLEMRIDFGTTNGMPDWQCGICQWRTPSP